MEDRKKVLVAGFFDLLHTGHIKFIEEASKFGDVYVSLGTDENSLKNKNKLPIFNEQERKYMLENLQLVKEVNISEGELGADSFASYLKKLKPDYFIINEDGDTPLKRKICEGNNVKYLVLQRIPAHNFKTRSTTDLRTSIDQIPHRLDVVGFYDQTHLSSIYPGSVILVNIEPLSLDERSGMSSSTRNAIRKVFGNQLPHHLSNMEIAKIIFAVENPPEREYISGVVDQLGICLPGINKLTFDNNYWPYKIETIEDDDVLDWFSSCVYLKQTWPRPLGYNVYDGREKLEKNLIKRHSKLGDECWEVIKSKNTEKFGEILNRIHDSQRQMIPGYENEEIKPIIEKHQKEHLGVKIMGAGGYGYMMIVSDKPVESGIKISIRKKQELTNKNL